MGREESLCCTHIISVEQVLTYYQNKPNSIVFLQETYTIEGALTKWENIWNGTVILSNGTANSRGVAILFHQDIKVKIDHKTVDENGRYIFLEGQINDNDLALLNYYAPTSDKTQEQIDMIEKLQPFMYNSHHKLILAGDLNCLATTKIRQTWQRRNDKID